MLSEPTILYTWFLSPQQFKNYRDNYGDDWLNSFEWHSLKEIIYDINFLLKTSRMSFINDSNFIIVKAFFDNNHLVNYEVIPLTREKFNQYLLLL